MIKQGVKCARLACLWLVFCASSLCFGNDAVLLQPGVGALDVSGKYLQFLEDEADSLTINEITTNRNRAFEAVASDTLNLGHTASSVWATFSVLAAGEAVGEPETWLLEIGYPLLKRVRVYVVSRDGILQSEDIGYGNPMSSRQIQNRFFIQPIELVSGQEYQIYINVMRKNGSVQLPIRLYRPQNFLLSEIKSNYVFGLFFGILLAMVVYNTYLYVSVGNRAYLYYILYILSAGTAFLTTTGYGYLFVWAELPIINEYSLQIPSTLGAITGLLFVRHFIKVRQYYRYIDRFISAMVGIGLLLIAVKLATHYFLSEIITAYVAIISVAMPFMAYQCYRKGSRSAGFFLIGWAALFVGIFLYTLSLLGILPSNTVTTNAVLVGAAMETLLLSLGLADRINSERREKYKALEAQHEAVVRLQKTEDRLIHRALHSGITGLPNRTFLRSSLESVMDRCDDGFVLALVSLNNFHEINRTLGHSNGDTILYLVTQRINAFCAKVEHIVELEKHSDGTHYLAGIEGITFAFAVKTSSIHSVQNVVLRLLRNLEQPFEFQGLSLDIDASASMARYPDHGKNSETLIRNAHIALDASAGKSEKLAVYSPDIDSYNERRITLISDLRNAIDSDQLQLYFQPQLSLGSGEVGGAEVLIRWIHPEHGFIPPDEFIPLAERTGVIHSLTYWICRKAFEFKSQLDGLGVKLNLSINISARNLQDPEFQRHISRLAQEQGVSLSDFVMELTETAIMTDPDHAMSMLNALHDAGVRLSIDDFGTGYSSLSYLKKLPVDELKIDRSFIMEMVSNSDDQLLVKTTLSMGHSLSMTVVAEGIEDESTLAILQAMGCDLAQGYHIARPMPGDDFKAWIKARANNCGKTLKQNLAGI